ncbi:TniB family NTP-binding protein [Cyanobacterium aponinum]|uniref:TniB family NTP-binding protein n=1 Tax=Cyanobacterium aponinum TaxID=379064 RepID=UPI000C12B869|nr:TniB family NTP-binding protein [Cyanobacterium aponinum]PHV61493.1 transposase [Cyanobacterium aponinum IPPAS B-1201]
MEAKEIAQQLGEVEQPNQSLQNELDRLSKKQFLFLDQVKIYHQWLNERLFMKHCCRVVGDSHTGKTSSSQAYCLRYKSTQESGKNPIFPVLYVSVPENATSKVFFETSIKSFGYRISKGTISDLRERMLTLLSRCQVKMMIIDEADRCKPETLSYIRDIFDHLNICIVLVGTDRLNTVLKRDEQVYNRFLPCYRYGLLDKESLIKTIKIWEIKILKLPVASNLSQGKKFNIIYSTSKGCLGTMDKLLRTSASMALIRGLSKIELNILEEAAHLFKDK